MILGWMVRNFVIEGVACQLPSLQATPLLQTSLLTITWQLPKKMSKYLFQKLVQKIALKVASKIVPKIEFKKDRLTSFNFVFIDDVSDDILLRH